MLDGKEHPGWVRKMMGHETLAMIWNRYYSYLGQYDQDEGSSFMDNMYRAGIDNGAGNALVRSRGMQVTPK